MSDLRPAHRYLTSWERERVSNTTRRSCGAAGEGRLQQDISPLGRRFLKINIVFWGNSEELAWLIFARARLMIYTSGPRLYRACPTAFRGGFMRPAPPQRLFWPSQRSQLVSSIIF